MFSVWLRNFPLELLLMWSLQCFAIYTFLPSLKTSCWSEYLNGKTLKAQVVQPCEEIKSQCVKKLVLSASTIKKISKSRLFSSLWRLNDSASDISPPRCSNFLWLDKIYCPLALKEVIKTYWSDLPRCLWCNSHINSRLFKFRWPHGWKGGKCDENLVEINVRMLGMSALDL